MERSSIVPAPLVLLVLILVGVGLGSRALTRQAIASRALSRRVRALATTAPEALAQAARQTGLAGRVVLVDAGDSFSFVYGAMTPRVAAVPRCSPSYSSCRCPAWVERRLSTTLRGPD